MTFHSRLIHPNLDLTTKGRIFSYLHIARGLFKLNRLFQYRLITSLQKSILKLM